VQPYVVSWMCIGNGTHMKVVNSQQSGSCSK